MDVTRERPQGLVCLEEDPSGPADGLADRVRGEGAEQLQGSWPEEPSAIS